MRKKDLPEIIFFEEKVGSNGIHCLDYKNTSNIKYIREDVVKNISSKLVLADSCRCTRCNAQHEDCLKDRMCNTCDNVTEGNFR